MRSGSCVTASIIPMLGISQVEYGPDKIIFKSGIRVIHFARYILAVTGTTIISARLKSGIV